VLLSLLAWIDAHFHWGLCASSACDDPRWRLYGSIGTMPLGLLGVLCYAIFTGLCLAQLKRSVYIASGIIFGAHLYLSWLQVAILHAACLICLGTALIGSSLFVLVVRHATKNVGFAGYAFGGMIVSISILALSHRAIRENAAPDPLIRLTVPAIYRPEIVRNPSQSLADRIRASKSIQTPEALIRVDIFLDFQCPRCAELNALWPRVLQALGNRQNQITTTYRIFLLEGHPIGWQAAFLALGAGGQWRFIEVKDQLFAQQKKWVESGDPAEALSTLPGVSVNELVSEENIKAAKTIIREDVAQGAAWDVKSSPCVVLQSIKSGRKIVLSGFRDVGSYVQVFQDLFAQP
jgi:protein-disulfide isomerase